MSVSARIKELNKRLAQKLTAKGVEASETETMTSLINKIDNLPTGQSDIDFSSLTDWRYFSYYNNRNTLVAKLKYSDTSNGTNFGSMFYSCSGLTTIPQLDTSNGTNFSNMFYSCSALTNLTIAGSINTSGMNLKSATKLSKSSITSVVNALSASASGKSITFSKTAVNNAFETSSGVADGSTSEEWTTLIATKANWTIALS